MTLIQNTTLIHKAIAEVYTFLTNLNNHEQLMPDNIQDWTSTADEAQFSIKNLAKLALKVSQRVANREIICLPIGDVPFTLKLSWKLEEVTAVETRATFVIEAELNMMMKMMVSGHLQKLVDHQVSRLKEVFG